MKGMNRTLERESTMARPKRRRNRAREKPFPLMVIVSFQKKTRPEDFYWAPQFTRRVVYRATIRQPRSNRTVKTYPIGRPRQKLNFQTREEHTVSSHCTVFVLE